MLPNKISEIKDPNERYGAYLTSSFFLINNLAWLKYLKVSISESSIRAHNSTCEFLEVDRGFQINPETLNYYRDEEK